MNEDFSTSFGKKSFIRVTVCGSALIVLFGSFVVIFGVLFNEKVRRPIEMSYGRYFQVHLDLIFSFFLRLGHIAELTFEVMKHG